MLESAANMGWHRLYGTRAGLLVGALAALAACSDKTSTTQEEKPVKAPAPEPRFTEVDKVALMESHYVAAITAHDMLIRNDLVSFRAQLARLSGQELPSIAPKSWIGPHQRMREAAGTAHGATDIDRAAEAMSAVVESCGDCHAALVHGPIYEKPEPKEGTDPLSTTMRKHQWATERLWEGVTGPWGDAWLRGAEAIASTELFAGKEGVNATLRQLEAELRAVGAEAKDATSLSDRSKLYGRLLAGCARCHDAAKVTLKGR